MATKTNESSESAVAREAAGRFGDVVGSSYSTYEGRPVVWAFHIETAHFGPGLALIRAGAEGVRRSVFLLVDEAEAFSGMIAGKALAVSKLAHHSVVTPSPEAFGGSMPSLTFVFYLSDANIGLPCPRGDLAAVGVHAAEDGLSPTPTVACLRTRTPRGITTPDPLAVEPFFLPYWKAVRALRRVKRLRALEAPAAVVEKDLAAARDAQEDMRDRGWTPEIAPLPHDVASFPRA